MRILVYGAGVIGCNLANDFYQNGKDVTLLARGKWYETIKRDGLKIKNQLRFGKITTAKIKVISELKHEDRYDVIFVVMRYTQLEEVIPVLKENESENIVFVGNNVKTREYSQALPDKNVLFAFALTAGHRDEDKVVSIDLHKIVIGQLKENRSNKAFIDAVFAGTKFKVEYQPNMEDYLLCHAAFVVPVAFACYYTGGNLGKIKRNKKYLHRVITANIEGYRAIQNAGHEILPKEDEIFETKKYRRTVYLFFKVMCYTPLGKICASDHAMNAVDEMSRLATDFENFMDENEASYREWKRLENLADSAWLHIAF
jgi:2-dehydropantoate 2-reductase